MKDEMEIVVESSSAVGDVLTVIGTVDGERRRASGWVSATTHFYPPDAYARDGNRVEGATPRAMTADEALAYQAGLLLRGDVIAE